MSRIACQAEFERLAREAPHELLEWIRSGELSNPDLSFAAEACQRIIGIHDDIIATLLPLLDNENVVVREGAIYGISHFIYISEIVRLKFLDMSNNDASQTIRTLAQDEIDVYSTLDENEIKK